jgi:hypothetical protein
MPARGKKYAGYQNTYEHGTNNVIDDRTGFKRKGTQCKYEWNNLFVWEDVWEERQPQDFLRGFPDFQAPKVARPESTDIFLNPGDVDPNDL